MADHADSDSDNTIRILVATDCHLGYAEQDPIRGNDSLVTFEEILQKAQKEDVDFVLLGGDLFHENKPSRKTLHGCMALLRKYCMGNKPCSFEMLSDQQVNFNSCQFPIVNYEDPNLNVSIPVFSIHGNHDDPTGPGNLCALDLLSVSGLVNYFGKSLSLENINMSPLLLQKGDTKLALYGLGSIRDERLHRLFVQNMVRMLRPKEDADDWFNILVLHQNRVKHGPTNYIPEQFLDGFLDLVIWGHEHECQIKPVLNEVKNFFVSQPGSSIATSLSPGESLQKHVGLLKVKGRDFKMTKLQLDTVRPFYIEDVVLSETSLTPGMPNIHSKVLDYCKQKVEDLLDEAENDHTGSEQHPKQPLIRLRVDYSGGFETFSIVRFGNLFINRVANTKDIVHFIRRKENSKDSKTDLKGLKSMRPDALDSARVEDIVQQYFSVSDEVNQLHLLTEKGVGDAVMEFVDKEEREAISELVKYQLQKTQNHLKQRETNDLEDKIDQEITKYKDERKKKKGEEAKEVEEAIERAKAARPAQRQRPQPDDDDIDSPDVSDPDSANVVGAFDSDEDVGPSGTRKSRGRGGKRARGTGRGSTVDSGSRSSRGGGVSRRGRGGSGKPPSGSGPGSHNIKDSFSVSQKRSVTKKTTKQVYKDASDSEDDDEIIIEDSDHEEDKSSVSHKRKASRYGGGLDYDSNSEGDDGLPKQYASKRKR